MVRLGSRRSAKTYRRCSQICPRAADEGGMRSALTAVAVAALLLLALAPVASAGPGSGEPTAVSLGDSFISGEGGRWQGNSNEATFSRGGTDLAWTGSTWDKHLVYGESADNGCHRSTSAEILSANLPGILTRFNLACSGATTEAVRSGGDHYQGEPPQADQLAFIAREDDVRVVVLSTGGNDLGFQSIITACVKAWALNHAACHDEQLRNLDEALPTGMANVRRAVESIQSIMSAEGYSRDDYRFVLQSYPSPVPEGGDMRYPQHGWSRLTDGGCQLWDIDADAARLAIVPAIASGLKAVAAQRDVTFMDLRNAFDGREACSKHRELASTSDPPSPERSEWVRFLTSGLIQGDLQESLHPNAYGQQALGRCLSLVVAEPGEDFICRPNGPGTDDMAISPSSGPSRRMAERV